MIAKPLARPGHKLETAVRIYDLSVQLLNAISAGHYVAVGSAAEWLAVDPAGESFEQYGLRVELLKLLHGYADAVERGDIGGRK